MNKPSGFGLLFAVLLLASVSSLTVKNTSAISFTTGPCPRGEARDYMGICFPVKECKASVFAAPGTCKEIEGTVTKGPGSKVTITAPNYAPKSPIPSEQLKKFVNSIPICNFHYRNCATWLVQGQTITSRY
jgi:hypothetical protein